MNWLKKGDKIKMLRDAGNLKEGETYTIDIVDKDDEDVPYYVTGHGNSRWVCADQFVPVNEFHIGSRIRLTKNRDCAKSGMAGTIAADKDRQGDWGVKFDNKFDGGHELNGECELGYGHWIAPEEMELLEDTAKPEFKVGQIYRVGDNISREGGNIIKITEADKYSLSYDSIRGEPKISAAGIDSNFAISLTLLAGKEIGEAIRKWDEEHAPKEPEYNEVKRHAKAGEYIKITTPCITGGCYKAGDVLIAFEERFSGVYAFTQKSHPDHSENTDEPTSWIEDDEYVVLEGYKPTEDKPKETKRQAKVGEFVRLIENGDAYTKDEVCEVIADGRDGDVYIRTKKNDNVFCGGCADRSIEQPFSFVGQSTYVVLDGYKPEQKGKHSYTESEVAEAKRIVLDTIREQAEQSTYILFDRVGSDFDNFTAYVITKDCGSLPDGDELTVVGTKTGDSKCSGHDEPNEWIGKCVALCKALHNPIPAFIMGD